VDRSSGSLAAIDTRDLKVLSTVTEAPDPKADRGVAAAQVSPDGKRLYVAGGSELLALDATRLSVEQRWPVAGVMRGLGISPDGQRLYLALDGRVAVLDASAGRQLGSIEVPDVRSVKHVERAPERAAAPALGG
jgi:DNA-binding beta-propeller fold protein YncE